MFRGYTYKFTEKPTRDGEYVVIDNDNNICSFMYTVDGGWNTHHSLQTGELFTDFAITAECMAEQNKYWLEPMTFGDIEWEDTLGQLLDEIAEERSNLCKEDENAPKTEKYEILEELRKELEDVCALVHEYRECRGDIQ